ncbi:hypothetical protein Bca4012_063160 [Brassica carinata]|uniref:Uncharacterized protein n=1 Tax=Brassica carinata TaxID=52824 RepID=A0A8X7SBW5_BRACI|nr:hypothetical protein Bca52824_032900 [Brassica carinata]
MAVPFAHSPSEMVLLSRRFEGREIHGGSNLRDYRDTTSSRRLGFWSWHLVPDELGPRDTSEDGRLKVLSNFFDAHKAVGLTSGCINGGDLYQPQE